MRKLERGELTLSLQAFSIADAVRDVMQARLRRIPSVCVHAQFVLMMCRLGVLASFYARSRAAWAWCRAPV
jgi:hypothetical protein